MLGHSLLNEQFNPFPTRTTVVFFGVCQVLIKQMGFRSFRTRIPLMSAKSFHGFGIVDFDCGSTHADNDFFANVFSGDTVAVSTIGRDANTVSFIGNQYFPLPWLKRQTRQWESSCSALPTRNESVDCR